ncbi:MAG: S8 family serine peptidase [Ignavibacteria bacterium]|nr:S8 family serine peptidase [Ignavibacteria bacterium]
MREIRKFFVLLIIFVAVLSLNAQEKPDAKYWIIFKDKGVFKTNEVITPGSEAYELGKSLLTERAIKRRLKVLNEENLISYDDLPLNEGYIEVIESKGINIIAKSRWFNGVSAYLNLQEMETVKKLDCVSGLFLMGKYHNNSIDNSGPVKIIELTDIEDNSSILNTERLNYGKSYDQVNQINVPKLHNLGINGKGVMIASFDSGFEWRNHEALRDLNVIAEYDFINKDDKTFNEISGQLYTDRNDQSMHGTATLSNLAGYKPGKIIGTAYGSDIILAKTEYTVTETPMEEDFYLEAAEWAELMGADIITSSLGYREFDEPFVKNSYKYENYDGKTAITTLAGNKAAYYGVVVVTSVGNNHQIDPPSIGSPADGDSIIAVGAVDQKGIITSFSSNGPTSDGRIKPDVVALGYKNFCTIGKNITGNDSTYGMMNGTSFSCPLTAGVCALILSAHPELTPMQVREALRNTADRSNNPDNVYGWGLVNAYYAALYWGAVWSNEPEVDMTTDNGVKISISLASKYLIEPGFVKIYYTTSGEENLIPKVMELSESLNDGYNSGKYSVFLDDVTDLSNLEFFFSYRDEAGEDRYYPVKEPFKAVK